MLFVYQSFSVPYVGLAQKSGWKSVLGGFSEVFAAFCGDAVPKDRMCFQVWKVDCVIEGEMKKERERGFCLMSHWLKPIPRHYLSENRDDCS